MAQKNLSFKQYKAMDLIVFAVIFMVLEGVLVTLSNKLINVNFAVSLLYTVAALVIMRWGAVAAIHLALGGIVFCLASHGDILQYVGFSVGNCFALLSLLYTHFLGKKKVRDSFTLSGIFVIIIYLTVCIGRSVLLSILKGVNLWQLFIATLSSDLLSLVITLIIVLISRKQDGLFEDQKGYLLRTQKERSRAVQNTNYDSEDY